MTHMYLGHPNAWALLTETGQEEVAKVAKAGELSQSWAGATEKGSPSPQLQSMLLGEAEAKVSLVWREGLPIPS